MRTTTWTTLALFGAIAITGCQAIGGFKDFDTTGPGSTGGTTNGQGGDSSNGGSDNQGAGGTSAQGQGGTHSTGGTSAGAGGKSAGLGGSSPTGMGGTSQGLGGSTPAGGGPGTLGVACSTSDTCAGLVCLFGYCRIPCSSDDPCGKGSICLGDKITGGCRLAGDIEAMCTGTCMNANLACGIDGTCRTGCSATNSCPFNGEDCIQGSCVGEGETGWSNSWGQCTPIGGTTTCEGTNGADLTTCNVTKPGKVVVATCETGALCTMGIPTATCGGKVCNAGEYSCDTLTLRHCSADETGYDTMTDCASAALCQKGLLDGMGKCGVPLCGPGGTEPATKCVGGVLNVCSADQQQFDTTDCPMMNLQCDPGGQGSCVALLIDPTEVTRGDYAAFLAKSPPTTGQPTGCEMNTTFAPDPTCFALPSVCQGASPTCDKVPQVCVDWCDAAAYCTDQGKHLCGKIGGKGAMVPLSQSDDPGQSTWMNACSAGGEYEWNETHMWTGPGAGQDCNGSDKAAFTNGAAFPVDVLAKCHSPVASYAAAFDLSGNVSEWENSCMMDVNGATASLDDVCRIRGGGFLAGSAQLRCDASPQNLARKSFGPDIGFRCCAD